MSTVSVVIPAFNASAFLPEAVESALRQSRPPVEVIVVDDGSSDGTVTAAEKFGNRVQLIRQANGGAARARNTGAKHAKGNWLAFLDADDVWEAKKLERQLQIRGASLVWTDRYNIGELDGLPLVHGELQPLIEGDIFVELLVKGNVITTSSVMIQSSVVRALGGFDENQDLLPAEDWDLWLRVAERHIVGACREPLVSYRLHPTGVSRNPERMNRARRLVVSRALALPRGRKLPLMTKRRIWSETFRTNGWDAARHGRLGSALVSYALSAAYWPLNRDAYLGALRALAGSH